MVVIVLIGILTAVIVPEMKGSYEDALLRSTSRELVNVFHLAYSRAVSLNQIHRVRLERNTGKYVLEKGARHAGREIQYVPLRDVSGGEGTLDTRISLSLRKPGEEEIAAEAESSRSTGISEAPSASHEDSIAFYPDGTADAMELLLQDRDGFRLALRVNPVTARVHVIEVARP